MTTTRDRRTWVRRGRVSGAAVAVALGLAACSEPVAPGSSGVTAEELRQVEEEVATLEDRVATLEDRVATLEQRPDDGVPGEPVKEPESPDAEDSFFGDPGSSLGREVTVRGEVAELLASTDVASAFRIAGDVGEPVPVVSVTPPPEVATGDVVVVSGTVVQVDPDTFEADFGIAADELFEDPAAWFSDAEGQVAIAAVRIQAPAGD